MKIKGNRVASMILAIIIAVTLCFIFGNSLKSPKESLEQSDAAGDVLRPIIDPDMSMTDEEYSFFIRKSGHFVEYAVLGVECAILAFLLCGRLTLGGGSSAALGCLLAANVDEFIQSFTGRGSMVSDVLLDFGGSLTGMLLGFAAAYAVRCVREKNREKR